MRQECTCNKAKVTLGCGHSFHAQCILRVARSDTAHHGLCPLCRAADEYDIESVERAADASRVAQMLGDLPRTAWSAAFTLPADWEPADQLLEQAV